MTSGVQDVGALRARARSSEEVYSRTGRAAAVQRAVDKATARGVDRVVVGDELVREVAGVAGYDAAAVAFDPGVALLRESGSGLAYDVTAYGADPSGANPAGAALEAADAAATAATAELLIPSGTYPVAADLTVSAPLRLRHGARLAPAAGVTLTLAGSILLLEPTATAFGGAGTVTASGTILTLADGGGGALDLLATLTPAGVAAADFDGGNLDATYSEYVLALLSVVPAADSLLTLLVSSDGGANYDAGASDYAWVFTGMDSAATALTEGSEAAEHLRLTTGILVESTGQGVSGRFRIVRPAAAAPTRVHGRVSFRSNSDTLVVADVAGERVAAVAVDALRVAFTTENIAAGTVALYGVNT